MHIFFLLLNIILVLFCSILVLAFLNLPSKPSYLLGLYVISYADVVLIMELAGLFSVITHTAILTLQILLFFILFLAWHFLGKPILLKPFTWLKINYLPNKNIVSIVMNFPLLILLTAGVAYAYIQNALKILIVPPNNSDSVIQHLARIGYWLQYKSFYPWPTVNFSQTTYPMNAELGTLWTILWWGNDQLVGFVQWTAVLIIMMGIYGLVRLLNYSRSQGAFTALLWTTLVQVLYQSSTPQNDLVVTSFWVILVYFLFAGLQEKFHAYLYLSGIALGLAIGTKNTSLMVLPALALVLILMFLFYHKEKNNYSLFARWAAASLWGFLLFGSYIYLQNINTFGHPLGPAVFFKTIIGTRQIEDTIPIYFNLLRDNTGRYIYQLIDFSPLPFDLSSKINPIKKSAFSYIFNMLGILVENPATIYRSTFNLDYINSFDENRSWFGPLMIFLIPTIIFQGYQGIRRWSILRISLVMFAISFFVIQSTVQAWTPAKGRYFMIAVTLAFPLMAPLLNHSTFLNRLTRLFLVSIGLASMLTIASYESGFRTISWQRFLSGQRNNPEWNNFFSYQMISENVPTNSSIGIAFGRDTGDYPLFGEYFTRQVTWVVPDEEVLLPYNANIELFKKNFENSDFLFTSQYNSASVRDLISNKYSLLSQSGYHSLWIRNDLRLENECDGNKWPFTKFFNTSSNIACPQLPVIVGITETRTPNGNFIPVIGTDADKYLEYGFLVKEEAEITFTINMFSGKVKSKQILQFTITGTDSHSQVFYAPFNTYNKEDVLNFVLMLKPDTYRIHIKIAKGSVESKILKIQIDTR